MHKTEIFLPDHGQKRTSFPMEPRMNTFPFPPTFEAIRHHYSCHDMEAALAELALVIRRESAPGVWISLVSESDIRARARFLKQEAGRLSSEELKKRYPLFGIPFAVKDNMDVAGMNTTAACPAFARPAAKHAFVIQRLLNAGAVLMGKTNMDQFATGLVGTRSPFGPCPNSFHSGYISGGSSSGSAHVVARGYVGFSLGTDTAGSIRIPAALNNLIGLKPSRGLLSGSGVVPACPSLDCVSVLALTSEDAAEVFQVASAFDEEDIWSRNASIPPAGRMEDFSFGIPDVVSFLGNHAWEKAWLHSVENMKKLGGKAVTVNYAPYREAAAMLYFGPYMAERAAVLGTFLQEHPEDCDKTVRNIILGATHWTAMEAFQAISRTRRLKRIVAEDFQNIDVLLLPSAPTTYTIKEVLKEPTTTNVNMSMYTNFVNILDFSAVAVPAAIPRMPGTSVSMPFGVTMVAPAFSEHVLLSLASRFHHLVQKEGLPLGAPTPIVEKNSAFRRRKAACTRRP